MDLFPAVIKSCTQMVDALHCPEEHGAQPFVNRVGYSALTKTKEEIFENRHQPSHSKYDRMLQVGTNKCIFTIQEAQRKFKLKLAQFVTKQLKRLSSYIDDKTRT